MLFGTPFRLVVKLGPVGTAPLRVRFADKNFRVIEREDLASFIEHGHPFDIAINAAVDHELDES